jgi:hypothetical protein
MYTADRERIREERKGREQRHSENKCKIVGRNKTKETQGRKEREVIICPDLFDQNRQS